MTIEMIIPLHPQLDALETYLNDLHEIQPANFDAYEQDKMLRRYAERLLHITIDACIQIGIDVLTAEGTPNLISLHRNLKSPTTNNFRATQESV